MKIHPALLLALLGAPGLTDVDVGTLDTCRVCGRLERAPSGECAACGAYRCATCEKFHMGDATRPCPGEGIEVP